MTKCKNCKKLNHILNSGVSVGRWCVEKSDSPDIERERICDKFVPMSQGDRIRSMTDEELRDFLYDMTSESQCHICAFKKGWLCEKPYDKSCHDGVMEWLKSEVGCE